MNEKIAVIGLGYVGLPIALAFSRKLPGTIGFDIDSERIRALKNCSDRTGECSVEEFEHTDILWTSDPQDLHDVTFFVIAVPTPIDKANHPDLTAVYQASETVGKALSPGAVVVYESTVYPGVTEDICGPVLARESGLKQGIDFKLGYSPERINPGDKLHTLQTITKVVSGEDDETLERIASIYSTIVDAGVHRAPSIKVAEAAKVIENTQRDLNIALMNELAQIFDLIGISTKDVLAAASTKWNFLPFTPGLVGGHCIGVDPYYLTTKAEELGYNPQVILAGRRINDEMGKYVAQKTVKLISCKKPLSKAKIGILGLTFKENVSDLRNSRVPDIVAELKEYGIDPLVHDAMADAEEAQQECGVVLSAEDLLTELDALILAVPHKQYLECYKTLLGRIKKGGLVVDVRSVIPREEIRADLVYYGL